MASFYTDFAAGYGTIWLVMFVVAFVTQSHIDAGWFGVIGFPVLGLVYAAVRYPGRREARDSYQRLQDEVTRLNDALRRLRAQHTSTDEATI